MQLNRKIYFASILLSLLLDKPRSRRSPRKETSQHCSLPGLGFEFQITLAGFHIDKPLKTPTVLRSSREPTFWFRPLQRVQISQLRTIPEKRKALKIEAPSVRGTELPRSPASAASLYDAWQNTLTLSLHAEGNLPKGTGMGTLSYLSTFKNVVFV